MSYNIIALPKFKKELKKLAKKYPSIKSDFANFLNKLGQNPKVVLRLGKTATKFDSLSGQNKKVKVGVQE